MVFQRKAAKYSRRTVGTTGVGLPDYNKQQTGVNRHEYTFQVEGTSLITGAYCEIPLLRFKRSFSGTADTPDSPTASNNYQTEEVMNGSKIQRFNSKIYVKSDEPTDQAGVKTFYLDVYEIATSFFDAYVWNGLAPTLSPVDFDTTATDEGEVDFKSTPITLTENGQKNSKFSQHYMKLVGRIKVDAGKTVILNINRVPPKCRRANSGMFWGLVIHNNSILNRSSQFDGSIVHENSFEEIPSENRLPWLH